MNVELIALHGLLAVDTYATLRALPEELRSALPSQEELADLVPDVRRHQPLQP